jgi:selenocysteine lyase/cysteine desulfurase
MSLALHFAPFRANIVGIATEFETYSGDILPIRYADWTASGRLYAPIEARLNEGFGQYVANTHTETNMTGSLMTMAYHEAKHIIKAHIGAKDSDVLVLVGSGMTAAINKWQRILGLRVPEQYAAQVHIAPHDRPVVFVTHMEHHSNQTTWLETICEVVVVPPDENGLVCVNNFAQAIAKYADRPRKIAAITGCSNITGIQTPYHAIAKLIHRAGGHCFVDFACSAPYVDINMHPTDAEEQLDAIYFSPHKFLGGPGTCGVLIFAAELYHLHTPDQPGGGTVKWTNPWGKHSYIDDIEGREDGGTPPFLQGIKTAMCIQLKEKMGVANIIAREHELLAIILPRLGAIPNLNVLAGHIIDRLGVISFYINDLHYNLAVRLLNDKHGVQVRGGCSCAGTYGHFLLNVDEAFSNSITCEIDAGNLSNKPGWVRMSIHPTMTDAEAVYLCEAVADIAQNHQVYSQYYAYSNVTNEFLPKGDYENKEYALMQKLFAW